MKRRLIWMATFAVACAASTAFAQPPGRGAPGREGPPGPGPRGPQHPLLALLDTNGDQVISGEEIERAAAALKKLDRNEDGKIDLEELRPNFGEGRRPQPPGGPPERRPDGPPPGARRDAEGDRERRPDAPPMPPRGPRGPGGPFGAPPGPPGPPSPDEFLRHAMEFDADGNGQLSRDELAKMAEHLQRRRGPERPDGDRPRPEGERRERPEGAGERRERPDAPERRERPDAPERRERPDEPERRERERDGQE